MSETPALTNLLSPTFFSIVPATSAYFGSKVILLCDRVLQKPDRSVPSNMERTTDAPSLSSIRADFVNTRGSQLIFDLCEGRNTPRGVLRTIAAFDWSKDGISQQLDDLQSLFIRLATCVPATHPYIISLLQAFYHCTNKEIEHGMWGTWGMNAGDAHSALEYDHHRAVEYVNINGFEAQLWRIMGSEMEDYMWGHPVRNIARAIEHEKPSDEFQTANAEVAAACLWMIHGSERLWALSNANYTDNEGKDWRGDLWTGQRGYSVLRWRLWQKRFRDVAEGRFEGVSDDTNRLAMAALTNMEVVEGVE